MEYLNIDLILSRMSESLLSLWTLWHILVEWRRIIILYIVIVVILWLVANLVYHNYFRVLQKYVMSIDLVIYKYTLEVVQKKSEIVRYEEARWLLFGWKRDIILGSRKNYIENQNKIKQDVEYAEALLKEKLIGEDEWVEISRMKRFVKRAHTLYVAIISVLSILTLWLYRLAHKRLHY